ncbi:hypothetical protein CTI14_00385 [Methylobacterium radiotolerans]|nr:hypothetical protein CTI14_00385 [Methylobacterium radiotolerans]
MSDESVEPAADPGIMFIPRMKGGKWQVIRLWSESVMNDHRLSRAAIKVAWGITQFLDDHARYYERRTLLAKRIGMTDRTLDKAIALLTEHRHIVAEPEWVEFEDGSKKLLTVTRPRLRPQRVVPTAGTPRTRGVATVGTRGVATVGTRGVATVGTHVTRP